MLPEGTGGRTSGIPRRSGQSGELWDWGSDKGVPEPLLQTEIFHDLLLWARARGHWLFAKSAAR